MPAGTLRLKGKKTLTGALAPGGTLTRTGVAAPVRLYPEVTVEAAFGNAPLDETQVYSDLSDRWRSMIVTSAKRSYELDRLESGESQTELGNLDSALNPENTLSDFYPMEPECRFRQKMTWDDVVYDLFAGITGGYPQAFPRYGYDATVDLRVKDLFLLFTQPLKPATTTLGTAITTAPIPAEGETIAQETIHVGSTARPMPQVAPFSIWIDDEWMEVQEIVDDTHYLVDRAQNSTEVATHAADSTVHTDEVSFGRGRTDEHIQWAAEHLGFSSDDWDLDVGASDIAPTENLAGTNANEYMLLMAEAERGRLFCAPGGNLTFHSRHWVFLNEESARATFASASPDEPSGAAVIAAGRIPYRLDEALIHDTTRLYNVVRITIAGGTVCEARDVAAGKAEKILEKTWPLLHESDGQAAAAYLLSELNQPRLRVPKITVHGAKAPDFLWPLLCEMAPGRRYAFEWTPRGGGDPISKDVICDGVERRLGPMRHEVSPIFTPADPEEHYFIVGRTGHCEVGTWKVAP